MYRFYLLRYDSVTAQSSGSTMADPAPPACIQDLLVQMRPRSKSLIVSLLGDAIEPRGGAFWIGTLIELLGPFGINERAVRTSVQRLSRGGWLRPRRHGRRSRYQITNEGRARIVQARPRFYAPPRTDWDGRWTMVLAPPGSVQGRPRARLRQTLEWQGYSMVATGLFLHPLGTPESLDQILDELALRDRVYVFTATSPAICGLPGLDNGVASFWDLNAARRGYCAFIETFRRWRELLAPAPPDHASRQAFQLRLLTIHAFRRAALHAPRLPAQLFPAHWEGLQAYALCRAIYQGVREGSEQFLATTFAACDEPASQPDRSFYERFGGAI